MMYTSTFSHATRSGIVRTEIDVEFEKYRAINKEREKLIIELEIKLQCLRDEVIRERKKRKKQNEGIKEFIQDEKEQRSRIENKIKEEIKKVMI